MLGFSDARRRLENARGQAASSEIGGWVRTVIRSSPLCARFATLFCGELFGIGLDDAADHRSEFLVVFVPARAILKFDAFALAPDQPRLAQDLKMLRHGRLGQRHRVQTGERRAVLRAR